MSIPFYVPNGDPVNFVIKYEDGGNPTKKAALEALWKKFNYPDPSTGQTFNIWYRASSRNKEVQVDRLMPQSAPAGKYRIEIFIPGKHATTKRAVFTVAHNFRLEGGKPAYDDTVTIVNMYDLFDTWYNLGEFELNPAQERMSGRVRQYDMSLEDPATEICFGPVRWVPLNPPKVRFDSPVGAPEEREGPFLARPSQWVGQWFDSNPFLNLYFLGYHTGADLNLSLSSDADRGAPVYAVADGVVIFAGQGSGKWGKIAVIEHHEALVALPNGQSRYQPVYSRYSHLTDDIRIQKGQTVKRGDLVGFIGLAVGVTSGWHLHFDISHSDRLKTNPSHWPNLTRFNELRAEKKTDTKEYRDVCAVILKEVVTHYVDPLKFLKDNH